MDSGRSSSWRLNERHYGALQGLNKAETAAQHGEEQVKIWRRSYDIPPPPLTLDDARHPSTIRATRHCRVRDLPLTESLKDTVARFLPYWHETIAPAIRRGQRVLIAAHGNSLRALVKHLDDISDEDIVELNIPTGIPLVYELDAKLKPIKSYYLGDPRPRRRRPSASPRRPRRSDKRFRGHGGSLATSLTPQRGDGVNARSATHRARTMRVPKLQSTATLRRQSPSDQADRPRTACCAAAESPATAPLSPIAVPRPVNRPASASTNLHTRLALAPNASRTAISRSRWRT